MPHRLAKMLLILLVTPGCKATPGAPERPEVVDYLMPRGRDKIELLMERKVWGPGRDLLRQPRMLLAERSGEGVIYSLGERVDHDRWRTSARLFFVATSRGAFIKRQEDLAGQPVGVEEPRLVIPWPLRPGVVRHLEYRLLGPQEDGSRTAASKVTVLRSGFHEKVAGKSYGPCVEVRELLIPGAGGKLDLKSTFCKGLGRIRIEQRNESLSRGESFVTDQVMGVREGGSQGQARERGRRARE